ncbi:MAG: hypothetical protein HY777_15120, partial [Betaproteobacteria bacterium]|nr:hypothetical protein [Betaproteobacteria bacterium]
GVLFQILAGWASSCKKSFIPLVIGFDGITEDLMGALGRARIDHVCLTRLRSKHAADDVFDERFAALAGILKRRKVSALVDFASFDGFASLLAASRTVPVQVYYSMGYHYMDGPGWDAFFCVGQAAETRRTYGGRSWRTVALSHQDPRAAADVKALELAGRQIRAGRFSEQTVVLGAIARPQKLDSDEFLAALSSLLKKNKNAVFLWFGKEELASVRQKMIALGISEQCRFEGYQSTTTYAQVLDIHLDPFPFPSGLSVLDTMCYGVPSVFMDTQGSMRTGVPAHIFPLLRRECGTAAQQETMRGIFADAAGGESLALLADSVDEYVALTQRLIDEPVFRRKAGRAGQRFMETFMLDPSVCYESFSRQILGTIAETHANTHANTHAKANAETLGETPGEEQP